VSFIYSLVYKDSTSEPFIVTGFEPSVTISPTEDGESAGSSNGKKLDKN
jgi:hypothetical protein